MKGLSMFRKLHELPKAKQHIISILISIICMVSAIALSSIFFYAHNENSANIALIFTLFILSFSFLFVNTYFKLFYLEKVTPLLLFSESLVTTTPASRSFSTFSIEFIKSCLFILTLVIKFVGKICLYLINLQTLSFHLYFLHSYIKENIKCGKYVKMVK